MTVLQKGKSIYPFWGAPINLITGLDPLSLQTTSEATYATMLPGISNLTNRLRYYGFYCWLIDFYFKKEKKGNSTQQYRFIRRAELMIAIIMQSERNEVLQITGSFFAANLIANQYRNFFDLADGADLPSTEVYWEYPSGAFGQYYYGAMRALSLVVPASNDEGDIIFSITKPNPRQKVSGKELSEAFDNELTTEIRELFYSNIRTGKLQVKDIPALIKYFDISTITAKSREWMLYINMLLDKDDPAQEIEEHYTFHRRETIIELINTAKENKDNYDWHKLLLKAYISKIGSNKNPVTDTLRGWYSYQFNEYFQYACGAIFWATLQHLYGFQQDQYLPNFIRELSKQITVLLISEGVKLSAQSKVQEVLKDLLKKEDIETTYKSIMTTSAGNPIEAAKDGFILLFQLYNENAEQLPALKEFMAQKKMIREGNMVDGINNVYQALGDAIQDYIEQFLLRKIIYRHQMVALRKMGNGSYSTQKFIIEEQYIKFLDTFPPRATSPRMNALRNLLSDLNVIDHEGKLTPLHTHLLTS